MLYGGILAYNRMFFIRIMDTIIDLDALERNTTLEPEELIYRDDCDKMCKNIWKKVENNVGKGEPPRQKQTILHHTCFFINGGRGSGKTTLMRAVTKRVCEKAPIGFPKITLLAEIDPTELADSEHFFIHMLGRVQRMLSEYRHKYTLPDCEKAHYQKAYAVISNMSRGLGLLINNPESLRNPSDADFHVQQSVEDCVSGSKLREEFAELIEELCKLFKVDAFLVTVDDADMNFNKCKEVFETVRKYLINPRMVYLFAGDLKLYTMVIRAMQMEHFGKMAIAYDAPRRIHRYQLLDVLEDQYVMKLFPVDNRVWLTDFAAVLESNPLLKLSDSVPLQDYLGDILPSRVKEYDYQAIKPFIGKLSTRSALQLLAYWKMHVGEKPGVAASAEWAEGIRRVATHALMKHRIDSLAVHHDGLPALMPAVVQHVEELNKGIMGAGLLGGIGDDSQQMVSFFLAAEVARHVKTPAAVLQYMLRIFPAIQPKVKVEDEYAVAQSWQYGSSIYWGALCTARMLPEMSEVSPRIKLFNNGVIPMLTQPQKVGYKVKPRMSVQEFVDNLTQRVSQAGDMSTICAGLAVYHAFVRVVEHGRDVYCLSVFNLLNTVALLLEIKSENEEEIRQGITRILFNDGHIPSSMRDSTSRERPYMRRGYDSRDALDALSTKACHFSELQQALATNGKEVVEEIKNWLLQTSRISSVVSPQMLSNWWSSFILNCHIATNNARTEAQDEKELAQAGVLFNQYLEAFCDCASPSDNRNLQTIMEAISKCPLCAVWRTPKQNASVIFECCNSVNIGPMEILLNRSRAEILCDDELKKVSETAMMQVLSTFQKMMNRCQVDIEGFVTAARERAEQLCKSTLLPLNREFINKKVQKGSRLKKANKRDDDNFTKRFMSSLESNVEAKRNDSHMQMVKMYHEMRFRFEKELDGDVADRKERILRNYSPEQDEKEFASIIARNLRGCETDYAMLCSSFESLMNERLKEHAEKFRKTMQDLVDTAVEEKIRELRDDM